LVPVVDARAVVLLKDHGQILGDEIVQVVVAARTGNVIRLERSNHFVLLLGERYVVYGRIYSRTEPK